MLNIIQIINARFKPEYIICIRLFETVFLFRNRYGYFRSYLEKVTIISSQKQLIKAASSLKLFDPNTLLHFAEHLFRNTEALCINANLTQFCRFPRKKSDSEQWLFTPLIQTTCQSDKALLRSLWYLDQLVCFLDTVILF